MSKQTISIEKCIEDACQEIIDNKRPRYLYKYRSIETI